MAVRTGGQSRAELTFKDLTITRLGENTIFSLNAGTRELHVEHGSVLVEVRPGAPSAKIISSVATAAVSGGTATFGTGPPAKFMVLEGVGTFYLAGHPAETVTLHGGEMATLSSDGHLVTNKFDVKTVLETSPLITDFPDLANLPLILQVIDEQLLLTLGSSPPPSKDVIDVTSQNTAANPIITGPPTSAPTPSEFGPPPTISSPNPYVITSGTTITTDPTIKTNGKTDFGTFYQGTAVDGSPTQFLFGEPETAFDQMVFTNPDQNLPVAVFKFSQLELAGNPTIIIPSGGVTNLALVSVGDITSGAPGGTLTFAGIDRLDFITQNGSIDLGSQISFSGIDHLTFYARGSASNLTLASPISGGSVVHLYSGGAVQVNGSISVSNSFTSLSDGDFLAGSGAITAGNSVLVQSDNGNVTFNLNQFPEGTASGLSVTVSAGNNVNIDTTGDQTVFSNADAISVTAANTLNMTGSNPTTLNLNVTSPALFSAGAGGIQASTVAFSTTGGLDLQSGGNINVYAADIPFIGGGRTIEGTINAAGALSTTGNVTSADVTAGTSISIGLSSSGGVQSQTAAFGNSAVIENGVQLEHQSSTAAASEGADLFVVNATAGTTINVTGQISAFGTITAGGDITANGVDVENINAPNGLLTVGSNGITAFVVSPGGAGVQETFNVKSIISPSGIDYSGNQFGGIDGLSSGGKLTINATTITFDSETGIGNTNFNGADSGAFGGGSPAEGGNGGTFIVNTTGDITANAGTDITATTGLNSAPGIFSGAGGSVTLLSSGGSVSVNDTIQVSSDDSEAPRQSASGGTIDLQSNLTTGTGITLGANGQLLSILDRNAPGPGGSITLSTMGADIVVDGTIQADRGTITIDQSDPANSTPTITIDGATLISDTLTVNGAGDINIGVNSPVTLNIGTLSLSAPGSIQFDYAGALSLNEFDAMTTGGNVNAQIGGSLALNGALNFTTNVASGANIASGAGVLLSVGGDFTNDSLTDTTNFQVTNRGTIGSGGSISVSATGNLNFASAIANGTGASLQLFVDNSNGGTIDTGGNAALNITGTTMLNGSFGVNIDNHGGSTITTGGNIIGQFGGDVTETPGNFHSLNFFIDNGSADNNETGGNIGVGANINLTFNNNIQTNGSATFGSFATGVFNEGGSIGTGGNISVTVGGNLSCGNVLEGYIGDKFGTIGAGGDMTFNITGDINDAGYALFETDTLNAGSIGSDASINISAANFSIARTLNALIFNNYGGQIGGNALISLNASGAMNVQGSISAIIADGAFGSATPSIDGDATVTLAAQNITTSSTASGTPGANAMALETSIYSNAGGHIGGDAAVNALASQNITAPGSALFWIANGNFEGFGGGVIGGKADVNVSAANISTGDLFLEILNYGGASIGQSATITLNVANSLTVNGSLDAVIDNIGGTIGGDATINMNFTNSTNLTPTATITGDATVQIQGDDPNRTAAINFNGGSYSVSGTFLSTIDGNGTITFNNTSIHANIVQAGVFGTNGNLVIGGNAISADTILKLYAPGSNGMLKFIADVTLSSGTAIYLTANTVTINNGVTVTIGGAGGAANVYTTNANYTGFGGNGSTTGTFAGNGANRPQPLPSAPPFSAPPSSTSATTGGTTSANAQTSSTRTVASPGGLGGSGGAPQPGLASNGQVPSPTSSASGQTGSDITATNRSATGAGIEVNNSGQLLSLLNTASRGPNGRITLAAAKGRRTSRNSSGAITGSQLRSNDTRTAQTSAQKVRTPVQPATLPKIQ